MANNRADYPEQFYTVPHIKSQKDYEICKLRLLTAIANEVHGVRKAIEQVHASQLKETQPAS